MIAGGLAGVLGAILIAKFDGSWVPLGIYTFILAAITFATTFIAPESQGRDLLRLEDALDDVRASTTRQECWSHDEPLRSERPTGLVTGSSRGIG